MSQNREPPAFQEYAAAMLSRLPFRTMTLRDRGLLFTMRLECWVNIRLPIEHDKLAKVLGLSANEVAESLTAVMPFFQIIDSFIISPELENYRAHLEERKLRQSLGGKLGSSITNKKRNSKSGTQCDDVTVNSRVARQGTRDSLVKSSANQPSQNQYPEEPVDPFVTEYIAHESCSAESYSKASAGRKQS
ncbi:MAG: hypothetical protein PHI29_10825 [Gallionella sp.]|nr:hypothetical protein [Gallionella sp.]